MQQARGEAAAQGIDGVGAYEDVSCPAMFVIVPGCCCRLVFFPFPLLSLTITPHVPRRSASLDLTQFHFRGPDLWLTGHAPYGDHWSQNQASRVRRARTPLDNRILDRPR